MQSPAAQSPAAQPTAPQSPAAQSLRIGVLLLPNFNIMATTAFVDPFRAANYLADDRLYEWQFLTVDTVDVTASNGMVMGDLTAIDHAQDAFDIVVVSASWGPENFQAPALLGWLRMQARRGAVMGGIDTGAFVLGYAGLLRGDRASVHFEHATALTETFADIQPDQGLFVHDARHFTCCGGAAAGDLALSMVRGQHGPDLANAAARYVFHDRIRSGHESQQDNRHAPDGHTKPAPLAAAITEMEANLEMPLAVGLLARRTGVSQRQLERLFKAHMGMSPIQYYLDLRLANAHRLITQTDMRMLDVAVANGFSSQEHFSRAYKGKFGVAPSIGRRVGRVPFQFREEVRETVAGS